MTDPTYKQCVKAAKQPEQLGDRTVRFTASTATEDRDGDIVEPRGIDTTNFEQNPVILFAHDNRELPVGKGVNYGVQGREFFVDVRFAETDKADDVYQLVRDGFLNAVSIGFIPKETVSREDADGLRFEEVELLEVSVVPVPSNPDATVSLRDAPEGYRKTAMAWARKVLDQADEPPADQQKEGKPIAQRNAQRLKRARAEIDMVLGEIGEDMGAGMPDDEDDGMDGDEDKSADTPKTKTVTDFQDMPLAPRDREWDSDAAVGRWRSFTGSEDEPSGDYWQGFMWWEADDGENFGAYKLPYVDVPDDSPVAVPRAIFAIASVLQGGRGGVDIPESDMDGVRGHVTQYYAKMRDEFDDESIVAPWNAEQEFSEWKITQRHALGIEDPQEPNDTDVVRLGWAVDDENRKSCDSGDMIVVR